MWIVCILVAYILSYVLYNILGMFGVIDTGHGFAKLLKFIFWPIDLLIYKLFIE